LVVVVVGQAAPQQKQLSLILPPSYQSQRIST
jgi:hypothetical protein